MRDVPIHTDYITLGQLLKYVDLAHSGGEVKAMLETHQITVDGEADNRRGRKLYPGMTIDIDDVGTYCIVEDHD